mgnify:CR=1 FL=1
MPTIPRCASSFALVLALVASRGAGAASATPGEAHPGQRAFAIDVARQAARPGLDAAAIEAVLAQARYQQSIIDAISRPAEKTKPWRDYRTIFLTPQRAEQGLAFWRENAALLDRVRRIRGVDDRHHFTLLCRDLSEIGTYARVDNSQYRLLKATTPGPYTFILEGTKELPRRVLHPKRKTIGLRVPEHAVVSALLAELDGPMLSSTLILPGEDLPMTDAEDIRDRLGKLVDLVIEAGYC